MPKAALYFSKPKNGDTDFATAKIDPTDITKPSPFLYHAWKAVQNLGEKHKKVTATIYVGRGIHFLFSCAPDQGTIFDGSNNY